VNTQVSETRIDGILPPLTIHLHGMCVVKDRDNFTLNFRIDKKLWILSWDAKMVGESSLIK
jgi:hypothetical protein